MERHKAMTSHEHVFRQVIIRTYIPQKVSQPFTTHERWWCNVCSQQLTELFFHCQACGTGSNGFDIVCQIVLFLGFFIDVASVVFILLGWGRLVPSRRRTVSSVSLCITIICSSSSSPYFVHHYTSHFFSRYTSALRPYITSWF
jgi:hypothetical protein